MNSGHEVKLLKDAEILLVVFISVNKKMAKNKQKNKEKLYLVYRQTHVSFLPKKVKKISYLQI